MSMIPAWLATNCNASLIAPQLAVTAAHWQWATGKPIVFAGQTVIVQRFLDLRPHHALSPDLALIELSHPVRMPPATVMATSWGAGVQMISLMRGVRCTASVKAPPDIRVLAHDTNPAAVAGDSGSPLVDAAGNLVGIVHAINHKDARNGISAINLMHADIRWWINMTLGSINPAPEEPTTRGRRPQPPTPMRPGVSP